MVRNTYIYPPGPSMRIIGDIFRYCSENMPKFNCISISGYHMQEAGATADLELGYTLADGLEYIRTGIEAGLDIDTFAPRLSFFWGIGMNHFMEIAKMRAARVLWAKIIKSFNPKNPKSMALRTHSQTSGWSLTAQDVFNNVPRTCVEALAAVLGHTQSLHTNALDEAIALPTRFLRAHRAQHADLPAGRDRHHQGGRSLGRQLLRRESLTHELMHKAWHHIQEIEALGGMAKAIETGIPKMRIEEAAARRQAQIDSGRETIVGVNKYQPRRGRAARRARCGQPGGARIAAAPAGRDPRARAISGAVEEALAALTSAARDRRGQSAGTGRATRPALRATLGEISSALEKVFGRYQAVNRTISGVYSSESQGDPEFQKARAHGRRVRRARKAAVRASWWPRWARTATIAAPR